MPLRPKSRDYNSQYLPNDDPGIAHTDLVEGRRFQAEAGFRPTDIVAGRLGLFEAAFADARPNLPGPNPDARRW